MYADQDSDQNLDIQPTQNTSIGGFGAYEYNQNLPLYSWVSSQLLWLRTAVNNLKGPPKGSRFAGGPIVAWHYTHVS